MRNLIIVLISLMMFAGCNPIIPFVGKNKLESDASITKNESNSPTVNNFGDIKTTPMTPADIIELKRVEFEGLAKIEKAKSEAARIKLEAAELNAKRWRNYFYWGVGILGGLCIVIPGFYHLLLRGSKKAFSQVKRGVDSVLSGLEPDMRKEAELKLAAKQDEKTQKLVKKT